MTEIYEEFLNKWNDMFPATINDDEIHQLISTLYAPVGLYLATAIAILALLQLSANANMMGVNCLCAILQHVRIPQVANQDVDICLTENRERSANLSVEGAASASSSISGKFFKVKYSPFNAKGVSESVEFENSGSISGKAGASFSQGSFAGTCIRMHFDSTQVFEGMNTCSCLGGNGMPPTGGGD